MVDDQILTKYEGNDEIVTIPEGIKKIGYRAFYGNKTVKKIIMPNTVTQIKSRVELVCDNDLMDAMIDKFGKDLTVFANDMHSFRVVAKTSVGSVFYSWVFGFNGKVSIKAPEEAKAEYAQMIKNAAEALEAP